MDDLEEANRRLLECASFDVNELQAALAQRGTAVRAIAASPVPGQAERLRKAFEDGRRIRARLASFYRDADVRLALIARAQAAGPQAHGVDWVG